MQATAKLSNYRQAPRKLRLIAGLVRGKRVDVALLELDHRAKRAAPMFAKLVKSALANAKALGMKTDDLIIKEVRVDKGPIIKRSRPRAQGRAFPIHKHTSHVILTLAEKAPKRKSSEGEKPAAKEAKVEKKPAAKKPVAKKSAKN